MAKKCFTDESLETFVDEIKAYTDNAVSTKANTSHNHAASNITSGTLSSDRLPTVPISKGGTGATTAAAALTNLGLTATAAELNKMDGVTATTAELNYVDGVTSNIQTQLNGKASSSHTHNVLSVQSDNYKQGTDLPSTYPRGETIFFSNNPTNKFNGVTYCTIHTIKGYNNMVCIQFLYPYNSNADTIYYRTSLYNTDAWRDWQTVSVSGHTHNYAGSSSAGGAANSAVKATQDASGNVITSTYATKTELDTAQESLQTSINGKANSSHTHTIANITNLQTTLDGKASSSHTHKYAGSSSAGGSATSAVKLDTSTAGDANTPVYFSGGKPVACTSLDLNTTGSAAKLTTARTIGLGTGATGTATSFNGTGNITIPVTDVKESYLSWGGKNLSGSVSPIDAACSNIHSANRFAFAKPAGITIEYSTNGSTYSAYSTTDSAKINLVSGIGSTYYIGARSASTTVNDKLRITLNATNMGLYTRLRKLLINISTGYSSGSNVIVEKAMKGSETTFTTIGTYNISGWSGWNSIPINAAFGGGGNQTGNIAVLRLTFGITGVNSEQTANALQIQDIIGIGDTYWSYPSTMAKTGHIYTYDSSQNTTFPANVTATTFTGALSGNATTATTATKLGSSTVGGAAKPIYLNSGTATACSSTVGSATQPVYMNGGTITACTYTLGKSVPSNAVFTDTNTKVTNTLATTTKAYITGTTSATTNTGTQVFDTGVYLDTTAGKLTATTFNGTTFSGSGVATVSEVKTYLGI